MYDFAAGAELDATKVSQKEYVTNLSTVINNTDAIQDGVKGTTLASSYAQNQFGKAFPFRRNCATSTANWQPGGVHAPQRLRYPLGAGGTYR